MVRILYKFLKHTFSLPLKPLLVGHFGETNIFLSWALSKNNETRSSGGFSFATAGYRNPTYPYYPTFYHLKPLNCLLNSLNKILKHA